VIEKLQGFYGFTRMPFGRDLAPGMLHRHNSHGEAVARVTWCVTEHRIGVITGEVGAGKTVAIRAALAALDRPGTPSSTYPTPPSESAASSTRSSSRWAANRWSTTPPSSPKPPTP
jgi:type II secretory pathway predicted ATPase ExeA